MEEGKEELAKFRELRKIASKNLASYQPGALVKQSNDFKRPNEPTGDPVSPAVLLFNLGSKLLGFKSKTQEELHNKPIGSYSGMVPEHLKEKVE